MPIVAVYKFRATFRSTETHKHALPRDGLSREGLLLMRQDADARDDPAAVAACATHGAFDAAIERYSPLDPAALAEPQGKDFVELHATAMSGGSAMMYYVNSAPAHEPPLITQAEFRPSGRR
jgi:hypothetical protein